MNLYVELKKRQQKRVDDFLHKYAFFAFSEKQFKEGLQKLGTTEDKLTALAGLGGFILTEHLPEFKEILRQNAAEQQKAIEDTLTGGEFAYQMFLYELANHEYSYTGDYIETLDALGYSVEDVTSNPVLLDALDRARKQLLTEAQGAED